MIMAKQKLIVYNKGNRKQHESVYGRDCIYVNQKFDKELENLQGLCFTEVLFLDDFDDSVKEIALKRVVTQEVWDEMHKPKDDLISLNFDDNCYCSECGQCLKGAAPLISLSFDSGKFNGDATGECLISLSSSGD